ncbi:hypothetical protein OH77DRAFT_1226266 [Trametes cingulata]|nr:hypothetical protein OH77DRAFT_1226266 [Trametes cingulata]
MTCHSRQSFPCSARLSSGNLGCKIGQVSGSAVRTMCGEGPGFLDGQPWAVRHPPMRVRQCILKVSILCTLACMSGNVHGLAESTKKSGLRPARRIFGRPPDGPGPQETFSGSFQIAPPPAQAHQGQFRVSRPIERDVPSPTAGPSRAPRERTRDRHREREGSSNSTSEQSTVGAPSASRGVHEDRLTADNPAVAAGLGARSRRPSASTHRATHSTPAVVTTTQAAGANFRRSRSSTAVAADILAAMYMAPAGPSSLPTALDEFTYASPPPDYGATRQLAPGTPGQHSPSGMSQALRTPSSDSLASTGFHHRVSSRDFHAASALDTLSYNRAAFSPAPPTPSDSRGPSVPPSVFSESSPYLGFVIGDFSPEMRPIDGDDEEPPPLSPENAPADLPRHEGRARSYSSSAYAPGAHGLFRSAEASRSSISVPEELSDLMFPPGLFDELEHPLSPTYPDLMQLSGLPALPPTGAPPPSRSLPRPPPSG